MQTDGINCPDKQSMKTKTLFIKLYEAYFDRLIFHASRFVDDSAEAEDIVSEVFADLWTKIDSLDLEGGMASYLYRAVSSRSLNYLRHKNIAAVRIEALEAINERRLEFIDKTTSDENIGRDEIRDGIESALSELPDKCREVFILSYVNGLKSKDIADAQGVSVRTVEAHIYKALRILRGKLKYLLALALLFLRME